MADKPRKRKPNASCSDDSSKDYQAVDISEPTTTASARWRRRSACNSNSSGGSSAGSKTESWMTKVTSAMSQRIFSGKKLGASRSTQDTMVQRLRQVSSENSLARAPAAESVVPSQVLTPVEKVDFCPSVVCDVTADDSDDNDDDYRRTGRASTRRQQSEARPSVLQSVQVRKAVTRRVNSVSEKVVPRDQENDDEDLDIDAVSDRRPAARSIATLVDFGSASRLSSSSSRRCDQDGDVKDTAPILKDFFSRNASTGQGLRAQQREARRETMYKNSFQRQERLRQRVEIESYELETQQRRKCAEQLQRATQQRRLHLRREAATACKHLASRLERDKSSFVQERERWEGDFEDEMRVLSRAFRKASAKTTRSGLSAVDDAGASGRPMTVAGLAVPEALSQIHRDASNYEKRLKTAVPRVPHRDRDVENGGVGTRRERSSASGSVDVFRADRGRERGGNDELPVDEDDYAAILCSDGGGSDGDDASAIEFGFLPPDDTASLADDVRALTVEELLDERQDLLRRIAELEQQLVVSSSRAAAEEKASR